MTREELLHQVAALRWFHRIDLGDGVVTPGLDDTPAKLRRVKLPESLAGKSVLDIGAWDGFFSFEAERRGASRVVAVDSYSWNGDGWGSKASFELARRVLNSKVEDRDREVLQLTPQDPGTFDVVLFLGVLYHMRHPLLALETVAALTKQLLILETKVDLLAWRTPAMAFYVGRELNNDPTNWWAPNVAGLRDMLRAVGFRSVQVVSPPRSGLDRFFRALKRGRFSWREFQRGRVAVHAWK
ncbi:MAG TPA: methyltransferase domain-containing protein [Opitutus sp.]|nr:methyltransferase domain-containing protein [Opitutus sp.]